MFNYLLYIYSFVFLLGCGIYSVNGSIPIHINSISVDPVINESTEFGINDMISERIMDILISENVTVQVVQSTIQSLLSRPVSKK